MKPEIGRGYYFCGDVKLGTGIVYYGKLLSAIDKIDFRDRMVPGCERVRNYLFQVEDKVMTVNDADLIYDSFEDARDSGKRYAFDKSVIERLLEGGERG